MRQASNNPHAVASPEDAAAQEAQEAKARELLVDEIREDSGEQEARRADRRIRREGIPKPARMGSAGLRTPMFAVFTALAIAVGGALSLAFGSWIWLLVALAAHAIGTVFVVISTLALVSGQQDKPDPAKEARLKDLGVADPGGAISETRDRN